MAKDIFYFSKRQLINHVQFLMDRKQNSRMNVSSASPDLQTSLFNVCLMSLKTVLPPLRQLELV